MINSPPAGRYQVGHRDDFAELASREFRLGQGDWPLRVFVIKTEQRWFAYRNQCPHAGLPLNWSPDVFLTADGGLIQCQAHGALFEKETGLCVGGPCPGRSLQAYAVEEAPDGSLYLEID